MDGWAGWTGFQIESSRASEFRQRIEALFPEPPQENTLHTAFRRTGLVPGNYVSVCPSVRLPVSLSVCMSVSVSVSVSVCLCLTLLAHGCLVLLHMRVSCSALAHACLHYSWTCVLSAIIVTLSLPPYHCHPIIVTLSLSPLMIISFPVVSFHVVLLVLARVLCFDMSAPGSTQMERKCSR